MKKISTLLASLPLITTACGGGGDSAPDVPTPITNPSVDLTQLKGIWSDTGTQTYTSPSGQVTTFQAPTALISSEEDMIILTGASELYVIESGASSAHYFSSFAYATEITPETSLSSTGKFNLNYYNPKRGANGLVSISSNGHYDSPVTLTSLAGDWDDSYSESAGWTFNFNANGSFTARKTGICEASGNLNNIDATKSELAVVITFTNCLPLEGTHTGLAWPEETNPAGVLNMAVYSGLDVSAKAIGWKLNKQIQ